MKIIQLHVPKFQPGENVILKMYKSVYYVKIKLANFENGRWRYSIDYFNSTSYYEEWEFISMPLKHGTTFSIEIGGAN